MTLTTAPTVPFTARPCPFCGVVTPVPHESQQGCIEALHVEIARMRGILDHVSPLRALRTTPDDRRL